MNKPADLKLDDSEPASRVHSKDNSRKSEQQDLASPKTGQSSNNLTSPMNTMFNGTEKMDGQKGGGLYAIPEGTPNAEKEQSLASSIKDQYKPLARQRQDKIDESQQKLIDMIEKRRNQLDQEN